MDMGTFRAVITGLLMAAFIGLWIWAWSNRRKRDFDAAARLPLDEGPGNPGRDLQGARDE